MAASQPPLYYALETIPYGLASVGTLLDRLALMRLLSALMGGLTALFAFLFLREALPGARWAWTVGGLGVALAPLLGHDVGRGQPRRAAVRGLGGALLLPGTGVPARDHTAAGGRDRRGARRRRGDQAQLPRPGARRDPRAARCCARREARTSRRSAYRCLALALGIGASPILLYGLVNAALRPPAVRRALLGRSPSPANGGSILDEISYIWQFYLPRLPGMSPYFHGIPHHTRVLVRRAGGALWLARRDVPALGLRRRADSRRADRRRSSRGRSSCIAARCGPRLIELAIYLAMALRRADR